MQCFVCLLDWEYIFICFIFLCFRSKVFARNLECIIWKRGCLRKLDLTNVWLLIWYARYINGFSVFFFEYAAYLCINKEEDSFSYSAPRFNADLLCRYSMSTWTEMSGTCMIAYANSLYLLDLSQSTHLVLPLPLNIWVSLRKELGYFTFYIQIRSVVLFLPFAFLMTRHSCLHPRHVWYWNQIMRFIKINLSKYFFCRAKFDLMVIWNCWQFNSMLFLLCREAKAGL